MFLFSESLSGLPLHVRGVLWGASAISRAQYSRLLRQVCRSFVFNIYALINLRDKNGKFSFLYSISSSPTDSSICSARVLENKLGSFISNL